MALERMGVQPFFTEEIGKQSVPGRVFAKPPRRAKKTYRYNRHGGKPRGTRRRIKLPSSLAVKIGVCVAACALMLGLKELDVPVAAQMVSGVRDAVNEEQNLAEMLGKLQFVELPRALEVFSDNSRLEVPVSAPKVYVQDDAHSVMWEGAPGAVVSAAAAGKVRAVDEDEILGRYVRLTHSGDLETIYYGLSDIQVEAGQPLRVYDTLGTLGESGALRLMVLLEGKPQDPGKYMSLVDAG